MSGRPSQPRLPSKPVSHGNLGLQITAEVHDERRRQGLAPLADGPNRIAIHPVIQLAVHVSPVIGGGVGSAEDLLFCGVSVE